MGRLLGGLFGGVPAKLLLAVGVAAVIAGVLFKARQAGRAAERIDQLETSYASMQRQRQAAKAAPVSAGGLVERLRDGGAF